MNYECCRLFADTAHNNQDNLYIASLNVGTGECHIIRKGDDVVIVDAGTRRRPVNLLDVMLVMQNMLGHNFEMVDDIVKFDKAKLHACFVSHPHSDHTNMIEGIISDNSILRAEDFRVFLGGLGNEYSKEFVNMFIRNQFLDNGEHNIAGFNILSHDVNHSLTNGDDQDINRFGAVIGLSFGKRRIAFMGDIDSDGFKAIVGVNVGNHIIGQTAFVHPMYVFLLHADIVTAPHHGSLNNLEGNIYLSLLELKKVESVSC